MSGAGIGGVLVVRFGIMRTAAGRRGAVRDRQSGLCLAGHARHDPGLGALTLTISAENLAGGMAGSAFIAYLSSLTNTAYTATQYALFSSLMTLPGKFIGGFSGWVVDHAGYAWFFVDTAIAGLPAVDAADLAAGPCANRSRAGDVIARVGGNHAQPLDLHARRPGCCRAVRVRCDGGRFEACVDAIALYSQGSAVVQDSRTVSLDKGAQTVSWPVVGTIRPDTLWLSGTGVQLTGFDMPSNSPGASGASLVGSHRPAGDLARAGRQDEPGHAGERRRAIPHMFASTIGSNASPRPRRPRSAGRWGRATRHPDIATRASR